MRWKKELSFILHRLIHRRRAERELDEEIRAHLEMEIDQNITDGMSPDEARLAARRSFGSVALAKENSRTMWGLRTLEILWQDLRYGVRILRKNPGFALVAIFTLSLGIAANTTIFSVADALVLRPFDFPHQQRLVMVWEQNTQGGFNHGSVAPANFIDWQQQCRSFEQMVAFDQRTFTLTGDGQPELFLGYKVSVGFFDALGVKAALGRTFVPGEDEPGRDQVVVLKESLWRQRFGSDPNIVGKGLLLDGKTFTVIGVMPAGFSFPFGFSQLWSPLAFDEHAKRNRAGHSLAVFGLLKPGVSIAQASADLDAISRRAQQLFPETNTGRTANVVAMNEDYTRTARVYVSVLAGVVAFVLLIACANVANMLISRAFARQREIAVRLALGASRRRLIGQMLTESLLIALTAGVIGLLLSLLAVDVLKRSMPEDYAATISGSEHFAVNRMVLLFTLLVSGLSSLLFGLIPAWQASKPNLNEALKQGAKGALSAGSRHRLRGALVVAEVALSLILAVGAGLMIRSFVAMMRDDIGFDPHNVLSFFLSLPEEKYPEEKRRGFYDQLLRRLETLPGVVAAGAISILPMSGGGTPNSFEIIGRAPHEKGNVLSAHFRVVTPEYFSAIGIPLRRGRSFTAWVNERAEGVVIINEAFAHKFFPNQEVIGQRIIPSGEAKPLEIIGLVGNAKNNELDEGPEPNFYLSHAQFPSSFMWIVLRTMGEPESLAAAVRNEVIKLDPTQPVSFLKTMERMIDERTSPKWIMTGMMSVFAWIALVIASVGLYAVMAYAVSQRTHEIGVRMALGAKPRDILRIIVEQGLKLTLMGLALGLAGAFALTRVMSPLLYGITPADPPTFILLSLLLACVALLACWLPARRATKVDPMIALRCE